MGLFAKFFSKKQTEKMSINFDTTQLAKTAEMLDEDMYWSIIAKSLEQLCRQL